MSDSTNSTSDALLIIWTLFSLLFISIAGAILLMILFIFSRKSYREAYKRYKRILKVMKDKIINK